jgi:U3 small nucleolar RNA-associated protein 22
MDLTTFQIINKSFTKLREHDPHGSRVPYFIATKEDVSGKVWTQGISLVIASRLTSLSRVALDVLSRDVSEQTLKLLFTPALKDYDIVIKFDGEKSALSSKKLRKASGIMSNTVKFKNLVTALSTFEDARSSADPVLNYYRDLVSRFGEVIVWSVRRVGGVTDGERVVTGLIVPGNEARKFRVGMGYPFRPTLKNGKEVVQLDVEDVLKQCTVLGGDMIKSVDLKK